MIDLLIRGTGLLGTSLGLAVQELGYRTFLEDLDHRTARQAAAMGAGSVYVCDAPDIVVVAVPPDQVGAEAAAALRRFPAATVTDVGSVKAPVVDALRADGADLARFVPGHPMAGREVSGPAAGRGDLFQDRPWILTPVPETDPQRLAQIRAMAEGVGSVVGVMDPHAHDRAVALCSHLPQVVASLLAAQLTPASAEEVAVAGQGLRDTTRIAASDPNLWSRILTENRAEVSVVLGDFRSGLDRLLDVIDRHDVTGLTSLLQQGVDGRRRLPDKHGGQAAEYAQVPVMVEDAPGQLAALFDLAGRAGVNLEDVRIEHTVGRLRAVVHLAVRPETEDELRGALAAEGWRTRG